MKQSSRKLLKRVLGRSKLDERALSEFFMEVQRHSVADLLRICQEVLAAQPAPKTSELELAVKRRLREIDGRAADFTSYLVAQISSALAKDVQSLGLGKKPSLAQAVQLAETLLPEPGNAVDAAFEAYLRDNDMSYHLNT